MTFALTDIIDELLIRAAMISAGNWCTDWYRTPVRTSRTSSTGLMAGHFRLLCPSAVDGRTDICHILRGLFRFCLPLFLLFFLWVYFVVFRVLSYTWVAMATQPNLLNILPRWYRGHRLRFHFPHFLITIYWLTNRMSSFLEPI